MNNNSHGYFEPLIAVALTASVLGWAWHQTEVFEPVPAVADVELAAEPADGPGHGNYCLIPERGAYFYGRDFDEKAVSYDQFAELCSQNGGDVGWIE